MLPETAALNWLPAETLHAGKIQSLNLNCPTRNQMWAEKGHLTRLACVEQKGMVARPTFFLKDRLSPYPVSRSSMDTLDLSSDPSCWPASLGAALI
jgi:hypothetical protein